MSLTWNDGDDVCDDDAVGPWHYEGEGTDPACGLQEKKRQNKRI